MAITIASLVATVKADTGAAERALGGFGGVLGKTAGLLAGVGVAAGALAIGAGIASLKMAGDFQQSMDTLVTGAGEAQSNLGLVSNGILRLAQDTGTSTKQLADGMFMIESAGFHGAAGLDILKAAAEGAKVGAADLGSVANAVTTEMVDYKSSNISAAEATNILIATVANGKTHMQDLANAMSTILPTASAARIGLIDIQGAMATLTGEGVDAANAATYLRQLIVALQAPSKQTAKALESIGLSTTQVANEMKVSLPDAIALIEDHLKKKFPEGSAAYVAALKDIAGGSKQMQGLLDLTGDHLQTFKDNVDSITGAVKKGGNSITGWALVQSQFNFKLDQAREVAETLGIKLGTFLMPRVMDLMTAIGSFLNPAIQEFEDLLTPVQQTATKAADGLNWVGVAVKKIISPSDDGSRAVARLAGAFRPIKNTFDESTAAAKRIADVIHTIPKPFDESTAAIGRLTNTTKAAKPPINEVGNALKEVAGFVTGDVLPVVGDLATFFIKDLVPALDKVWGDFQKDVLPTLGKVASFIRADVLPTVEKLALWFVTKVVPAAMQVVKWFGDDVLPILKQVWGVISSEVIPVLEGIAENVMGNLVPAIEHLISKVGPILIPIFHQVGDILKNEVGPALNIVIGFVSGLINVVATIIGKIGDFLGLLGQIKDKVSNIPVIGGLLPHFAEGGTMPDTGWALVGEKGPELVKLPGGAQVISNAETAGMQKNAPSLTTSPVVSAQQQQMAALQMMHFTLQLDTRTIAEKVLEYAAGHTRMRAGLRGA